VNSIALKAISATLMMSDRISHFNALVHENICEALEITKNITGDYVEIGVYKGGSALTALNYVNIASSIGESVRRNFWLLDTFDGFNYDTASNSSDVIWSGTHKLFGPKETMDFIETTLKDIPLTRNLVQCNICEASLPSSIQKIAVANIDVDIYEATRDSLRKVSPLIQPGGIIICEDPTSTPALYGALLAMEEFLSTNEGKRYTKIFKRGQYFLIKEKT
jgi:hypothetical protein